MGKEALRKKLLLTLASFVIVATVLIIYCRVPLLPLLAGGLLALLFVLAPYFPFRK